MKKEYYVFVLQKEKKYINEVIAHLIGEDYRNIQHSNDFLEERGILSASFSEEDATALKLRFPFVKLMPVGEVIDMIGQFSMTEGKNEDGESPE